MENTPVERKIVLVLGELRQLDAEVSLDTKVSANYVKKLKSAIAKLENIKLGDFLD